MVLEMTLLINSDGMGWIVAMGSRRGVSRKSPIWRQGDKTGRSGARKICNLQRLHSIDSMFIHEKRVAAMPIAVYIPAGQFSARSHSPLILHSQIPLRRLHSPRSPHLLSSHRALRKLERRR